MGEQSPTEAHSIQCERSDQTGAGQRAATFQSGDDDDAFALLKSVTSVADVARARSPRTCRRPTIDDQRLAGEGEGVAPHRVARPHSDPSRTPKRSLRPLLVDGRMLALNSISRTQQFSPFLWSAEQLAVVATPNCAPRATVEPLTGQEKPHAASSPPSGHSKVGRPPDRCAINQHSGRTDRLVGRPPAATRPP